MNFIQFSTTPHLLLKEKIDDLFFKNLVDYGFNAVELSANYLKKNFENLSDVKRISKKHDVEIRSIHFDLDAGSPKGIRKVESIIDDDINLSSELGASFLVIHLGIFANPDNMIINQDLGFSVFRDMKSPEAVEQIKEKMAEYTEKAKSRGITIALETDYQMNELLPGLLSYSDKQSSGICLDTGHAQIQGDAVEILKLISHRVVCTHLNDNNGKDDLHLPPFQGVINWHGIFEELRKVDYNGPYTFECVRGVMEDIVEAREKILTLQ